MKRSDKNFIVRGWLVLKEGGLKKFFKKIFSKLPPLLLPILTIKSKFFGLPVSLQKAIETSISRWFGLIKPMQVREEITDLLQLLQSEKPSNVLEIGTANGGTLYLFSRVADHKAHIISVDLPGGDFGGGYSFLRIPLYKTFARKQQKISLIRANSHNKKTVDKTKKRLKGEKLDFLFIDGDHTYEGVKKDFELYSSLVKDGGIIALHDIAKHPPETGVEVKKFWDEIKDNFKTKEFIHNKKQGWGGIGVIFK